MSAMTYKVFLELDVPTEEDTRGDVERLREALLRECGTVRIPTEAFLEAACVIAAAEYRVTVTLLRERGELTLIRTQAGDTTAKHYGLACDLGSTTIAVQLVDLKNGGHVVDTRTGVNRQVARGTDILTRIFFTREEEHEAENRDIIRALAVASIDALIAELFEANGIDAADCAFMVLAGNTTMIHFLLGLDAFCVFAAPYVPKFNAVPMLKTRALGFDYDGTLYCYPCAQNYLGGDIVSGLLATKVQESEGLTLFVDIGTNGEMAIGCRDFLIAGAGAAGPALEGGISKSGMRAAPGAVETVRIEQDTLRVTTIGDEKPVGICGSGIVDLLAQMLLSGWMSPSGRLNPQKSSRMMRSVRENGEEEWAVAYATAEESGTGEALIFTESDIEQFTRTKAAAHTMVSLLLEASGVSGDALERICLAGAFGEHLNLESAITIGLYPDLPRERFVLAGNTSLEGARSLLCDAEGLKRVDAIMDAIYYLQFAAQPSFIEKMVAARFYPHTDLSLYPSVKLP